MFFLFIYRNNYHLKKHSYQTHCIKARKSSKQLENRLNMKIKEILQKAEERLGLSCPICLRKYDGKNLMPMCVCPSQHDCCLECLDMSLTVSVSKLTCPICRKPIDRMDIEKFRLKQEVMGFVKEMHGYYADVTDRQAREIMKLKEQLYRVNKKIGEDKGESVIQEQQEEVTEVPLAIRPSNHTHFEKFGVQVIEDLFMLGKFEQTLKYAQQLIYALGEGINSHYRGLGFRQDIKNYDCSILQKAKSIIEAQKDNLCPFDGLTLSLLILSIPFKAGQELFNSLISVHERSYRLHYGLALFSYYHEQYAQISKLCEIVLELNPNYSNIIIVSAYAYHQMEKSDHVQQIIQLFQGTYPKNPYMSLLKIINKKAVTGLKEANIQAKQYKKLDELNEFLALNLDFQLVKYQIGIVLFESGQYRQAVGYFQQYAKISYYEKDRVTDYAGRCHFHVKNYQKAINSFQSCFQTMNYQSKIKLLKSYYSSCLYQKVCLLISNLTDHIPKCWVLNLYIGFLLERQRRYQRAIQAYKRSLDIYHGSQASLFLGLVYQKNFNFNKARKYLQIYGRVRRQNALPYKILAFQQYRLKSYYQSIVYFQTVIKLRKNYLKGYRMLAEIHRKIGDEKNAINYEKKRTFVLRKYYKVFNGNSSKDAQQSSQMDLSNQQGES